MKIGPWKRLQSTQKYENPWIRVREDQVIHPDGSQGIYGVVEYKNLAVGVIPLFNDHSTVLVGQYRYPLQEYSWEIPEGGASLSEGESPVEAAQRELLEETGLVAEIYEPLGELRLSNSVSNEKGYLFIASNLTQKKSSPEGSEQLELRRIPFEDAYKMAISGEITDSLSVAGITRVYDYLLKKRNIGIR